MPRSHGLAFANVFEQLRLSAGMSPADVARRLDAPDSLVSRWRSGKSLPSLMYLERLSEIFGVDRTTLERLAGYRASPLAGAQDTVDPEIAALLDSERSELHDELRGIPRVFWPVILAAQKTARRLAVNSARAALEISSGSAPDLAGLVDPAAQHEQGHHFGSPGPLSRPYALAGAH